MLYVLGHVWTDLRFSHGGNTGSNPVGDAIERGLEDSQPAVRCGTAPAHCFSGAVGLPVLRGGSDLRAPAGLSWLPHRMAAFQVVTVGRIHFWKSGKMTWPLGTAAEPQAPVNIGLSFRGASRASAALAAITIDPRNTKSHRKWSTITNGFSATNQFGNEAKIAIHSATPAKESSCRGLSGSLAPAQVSMIAATIGMSIFHSGSSAKIPPKRATSDSKILMGFTIRKVESTKPGSFHNNLKNIALVNFSSAVRFNDPSVLKY